MANRFNVGECVWAHHGDIWYPARVIPPEAIQQDDKEVDLSSFVPVGFLDTSGGWYPIESVVPFSVTDEAKMSQPEVQEDIKQFVEMIKAAEHSAKPASSESEGEVPKQKKKKHSKKEASDEDDDLLLESDNISSHRSYSGSSERASFSRSSAMDTNSADSIDRLSDREGPTDTVARAFHGRSTPSSAQTEAIICQFTDASKGFLEHFAVGNLRAVGAHHRKLLEHEVIGNSDKTLLPCYEQDIVRAAALVASRRVRTSSLLQRSVLKTKEQIEERVRRAEEAKQRNELVQVAALKQEEEILRNSVKAMQDSLSTLRELDIVQEFTGLSRGEGDEDSGVDVLRTVANPYSNRYISDAAREKNNANAGEIVDPFTRVGDETIPIEHIDPIPVTDSTAVFANRSETIAGGNFDAKGKRTTDWIEACDMNELDEDLLADAELLTLTAAGGIRNGSSQQRQRQGERLSLLLSGEKITAPIMAKWNCAKPLLTPDVDNDAQRVPAEGTIARAIKLMRFGRPTQQNTLLTTDQNKAGQANVARRAQSARAMHPISVLTGPAAASNALFSDTDTIDQRLRHRSRMAHGLPTAFGTESSATESEMTTGDILNPPLTPMHHEFNIDEAFQSSVNNASQMQNWREGSRASTMRSSHFDVASAYASRDSRAPSEAGSSMLLPFRISKYGAPRLPIASQSLGLNAGTASVSSQEGGIESEHSRNPLTGEALLSAATMAQGPRSQVKGLFRREGAHIIAELELLIEQGHFAERLEEERQKTTPGYRRAPIRFASSVPLPLPEVGSKHGRNDERRPTVSLAVLEAINKDLHTPEKVRALMDRLADRALPKVQPKLQEMLTALGEGNSENPDYSKLPRQARGTVFSEVDCQKLMNSFRRAVEREHRLPRYSLVKLARYTNDSEFPDTSAGVKLELEKDIDDEKSNVEVSKEEIE